MPKISELTYTSSPTTADSLPIVQSGVTKKTTLNDLPVSTAAAAALSAHTSNTSNPHAVTKSQVGLGNVDNTSDVNKPVSTAQQTALDSKTIGMRMMGLVGAPNGTTPLTKYDLSADAVTLRNSSGVMVTRFSTGTLTCDLGLAGSAANGRDQAGAFAINSWIYLYFIWNGTTLATLASTTAPSAFTGATLPSGYTHWAFATAIRWNASSNIIAAFTRGSRVMYDTTGSPNRVLSGGAATTLTGVSCSAWAPPNTTRAVLMFFLSITLNSIGALSASARPTGGVGQQAVCAVYQPVSGTSSASSLNTQEFILNSAQSLDYMLSGAVTAGGLYIDVVGYVIPNGDC